MVIALLIVLLFIGSALVGAIYSSFIAFYADFSDTVSYNKAYYGAVSGVERAQLVLRYRDPGFEGTGGRIRGNEFNSSPTDKKASNFSHFTQEDNGILRNIQSRTTSIPRAGEGNVNWMFLGNNSLNYNTLDYSLAENFILSIDNSNGNFYKKEGTKENNTVAIRGEIRLPPALKNKKDGSVLFGDLATEPIMGAPLADIGEDGIYDDTVVDWSIRGEYNNSPFMIFPTVGIRYFGDKAIQYDKDSTIRESRINGEDELFFGPNFGPFNNNTNTEHTVISQYENTLKTMNFSTILTGNNSPDLKLRIALLNTLFSKEKFIYPYLEYTFSFFSNSAGTTPAEVSDRFFTITSSSKVGNYEVKLSVKKPTVTESILGSFTVIF
ncbi:MAG: hypothetical protein PHU61_02080 [Candidatus Absconditabacteria bacterium]|nr:hypothetical protein [Candidatus Absconditabacteria bacterium]MDD3868769.1 hypothetical protein [Candidatus Absconditabacteria bacterium]MDD4713928.1 hypothetical protein [Candidatus Absconditabacteria bacterium]